MSGIERFVRIAIFLTVFGIGALYYINPNVFEGWAFLDSIENSWFGDQLGFVWKTIIGVIGPENPIEFAQRTISGLLNAAVNATFSDIFNALVVGLVVTVITWLVNLIRYRGTRRLCAFQIYLVSIQIIENRETLFESAIQADQDGLVIQNNDNTREALVSLENNLDVLTDFALAYEHAFRRASRLISIPARMFALSTRGVIYDIRNKALNADDFGAGIDISNDCAVFLSPRNTSGDKNKLTPYRLDAALDVVVSLNLLLASSLEGRSPFTLWAPAYGRAAPRAMRPIIQRFLKIARHNLRKGNIPDYVRLILPTEEPPVITGNKL